PEPLPRTAALFRNLTMKTKMSNAAPNAAEVWKQIEDILVPQLRLSVPDHSVYSYLLRHSRLEGKLRLRFSIQWLARAVADQALGSFGEETLLDGGFDEFCFMRRSAATCTARGRPWPSLIAMILLPLPRRVGPTAEPPFSPN
ncbi:MAG: hypothetical protein WA817_11635, partial [Candidatus Acidiferrum sp.]